MNKTPPEIFITRRLLNVILSEWRNNPKPTDADLPSETILDFCDWVMDCTEPGIKYILPNGLFGRHKKNRNGSALHHVHMEPVYKTWKKGQWDDEFVAWTDAYNEALDNDEDPGSQEIFEMTPTSDVCLLFAIRNNFITGDKEYLLIDLYTDTPPGAHALLWNNQPNALLDDCEEKASSFTSFERMDIFSLDEVLHIQEITPHPSSTSV